ncbi:hypothetical protein Scep_015090 [Stephania cephalantha]|uniref:Uncharacterized protein n=1 Tax=Stephania cephalantha TaxID=152367 RepID=A0AAP0J2J5_9MAGN
MPPPIAPNQPQQSQQAPNNSIAALRDLLQAHIQSSKAVVEENGACFESLMTTVTKLHSRVDHPIPANPTPTSPLTATGQSTLYTPTSQHQA